MQSTTRWCLTEGSMSLVRTIEMGCPSEALIYLPLLLPASRQYLEVIP